MTLAVERLAQETGHTLPEGESNALARSLPDWPPFPEVPDALGELRDARLEARDPLELRPRARSPRRRSGSACRST